MIFDFIEPIYFFGALILGLIYALVYRPPNRIVTVHPTPFNAGKIVYKDDANVCYKYDVIEVSCPNK